MALAQSVKAPRKAPAKTRDPAFSDEKYTGREPVWDTERAATMSQDEFDHFLRKSFFYYNYYYTQKDCKKHVVKWMQDNQYSKSDISAFIRSSDRSIPMTACGLVMAARQGMPLREKELTYLKERLHEAINSDDLEPEAVAVDKPVVQVVKAPTIQDRLNEKTAEQIGEIEGIYDDVVNDVAVQFKPYDFFTVNSVPQSQLSKFADVYTKRQVELELARSKEDEQLAEAYKHYKSADYKRIFSWIEDLLAAIEQYRGVKKANKKLRKPRAVSKEKVVAKLKYLKEEKTLKLVSVNPVDIIGAQELWVYNTKTRKLGKYIADSLTGPLNIKGTAIICYDTTKSVSKTLRKPEEKLKEFGKAGKVELRKFLENIKATETILNGRINSDMILLKVA